MTAQMTVTARHPVLFVSAPKAVARPKSRPLQTTPSTTVVLLYVYIRVAVKTARSGGLLRTALYIHFHPRRTNCALEFLTADS